ncbi:MAG: hypothetical protein EOP51_09810 [Sphingobacteriales bacterium]|nr:MAG: hypothetical protein EOP51_09810 [Sphingobacteriales bacterium]
MPFVALLQSCSKTLPLPSTDSQNAIVMIGELVAEENAALRAGQTIGVNVNGSKQIAALGDLSLSIKDENGADIAMSGMEDSLTSKLKTIPFTANIQLQPKHSYTLTARHSKLGTANVTVPIPQPFTARLISAIPVQFSGEDVVKFTIQIDDPQGEDIYSIECVKQQINVTGEFQYKGQWLDIPTNYFLYDSLRQQNHATATRYDTTFYNVLSREYMYTSDPNTDNVQANTTTYAYSHILLKDTKFNGGQYTTEVYARKTDFNSTLFNGQLVLMVKSISKDYYTYLGQYEGTTSYTFSSNDVPATIKGNVANGFGIVGGAYKRQFNYVVDDVFPY